MAEIGLSEVIKALRSELEEAMTASAGEKLRFVATQLEVEFQVGVSRVAEGKAGVKFWVFEIGGGGSRTSNDTQTVTLQLTPTLEGGGSVKVAGETDVNPLASNADG